MPGSTFPLSVGSTFGADIFSFQDAMPPLAALSESGSIVCFKNNTVYFASGVSYAWNNVDPANTFHGINEMTAALDLSDGQSFIFFDNYVMTKYDKNTHTSTSFGTLRLMPE